MVASSLVRIVGLRVGGVQMAAPQHWNQVDSRFWPVNLLAVVECCLTPLQLNNRKTQKQ